MRSRNPVVALALEGRNVLQALRGEHVAARVGPLAVSGMLAEQLAKELSAGAAPRAVVVSDDPEVVRASVAIRIVAGHPSDDDERFVRRTDRVDIPIVVVQLWPQEDWRGPFVLSPFVVECKTGEGFPVRRIAEAVASAADDATSLAARVPALKEVVERSTKRRALARAAFVGATLGPKGAARPVLALEQAGLVARMRALEEPEPEKPGTGRREELPVLAATAATAIVASFGFRELARRVHRGPSGRLSDAAIAAGGTWLLCEIVRRLEARSAG